MAISFIFCPCHLPVTLAIIGVVLGGTTAGALLSTNLIVAGVVITAVWVFGTWRGLKLIRNANSCELPNAKRTLRQRLAKIAGIGA